MVTDTDTSASSAPSTSAYRSFFKRFWQGWQVQSVLLAALCLFGLVIAVDSFQEAIAAAILPASAIAHSVPASQPSPSSPKADVPFSNKTYLEFDSKRANRLGHSDLLKPNLTRSRLTDAHLFTTLVR